MKQFMKVHVYKQSASPIKKLDCKINEKLKDLILFNTIIIQSVKIR